MSATLSLKLKNMAPIQLWSHVSLWVVIPVLSALNQACLKLLASRMAVTDFGRQWLQSFIQQPLIWGVIICEGLAFVLWLDVLSKTSMSKATPLTAGSYILILLLGWTVFHENINAIAVVGCLFILLGMILIGCSSPHSAGEKL